MVQTRNQKRIQGLKTQKRIYRSSRFKVVPLARYFDTANDTLSKLALRNLHSRQILRTTAILLKVGGVMTLQTIIRYAIKNEKQEYLDFLYENGIIKEVLKKKHRGVAQSDLVDIMIEHNLYIDLLSVYNIERFFTILKRDGNTLIPHGLYMPIAWVNFQKVLTIIPYLDREWQQRISNSINQDISHHWKYRDFRSAAKAIKDMRLMYPIKLLDHKHQLKLGYYILISEKTISPQILQEILTMLQTVMHAIVQDYSNRRTDWNDLLNCICELHDDAMLSIYEQTVDTFFWFRDCDLENESMFDINRRMLQSNIDELTKRELLEAFLYRAHDEGHSALPEQIVMLFDDSKGIYEHRGVVTYELALQAKRIVASYSMEDIEDDDYYQYKLKRIIRNMEKKLDVQSTDTTFTSMLKDRGDNDFIQGR